MILCNSSSQYHCFNTEELKDSNCLECILGCIIEIHFFSTVTSSFCILNFPGQGLCTGGLKPSMLDKENLYICSVGMLVPGSCTWPHSQPCDVYLQVIQFCMFALSHSRGLSAHPAVTMLPHTFPAEAEVIILMDISLLSHFLLKLPG